MKRDSDKILSQKGWKYCFPCLGTIKKALFLQQKDKKMCTVGFYFYLSILDGG